MLGYCAETPISLRSIESKVEPHIAQLGTSVTSAVRRPFAATSVLDPTKQEGCNLGHLVR
ncbi:hypothetical protein OIDMADRAFT_20535 [Oidiodendron maius Zn]|uniref:Uncharacterized protein n=1 Tax=Oidiodendron maius (strain Zn) TaxID=913774 RepID=A0A0C3H1S5_OIDMZ|nr:hypothetical protein OIDMADRAFT_20535 [Oidiodendron maius Zn]